MSKTAREVLASHLHCTSGWADNLIKEIADDGFVIVPKDYLVELVRNTTMSQAEFDALPTNADGPKKLT